jgi:hypothetical protein
MRRITVTGQLLFDGGFCYLIAPEGIFHILSAISPNHPVDGTQVTSECEIIPGYGKGLDGRTFGG